MKLLNLRGGRDIYEYMPVVLENGVRVLLSHDPTADKGSVALSVKAGGFSDPEKFPGLAHFLEHMLFMGTEKHPKENYYSEYITKHNGRSNAYTASEQTVYYFDIDVDHLEKAIDIFSGFFTCPLIKQDSLEREREAVDNENKNNIMSENWRKYHLYTLVSKDNTPFSKFQTGSIETLKDAKREDLEMFWKQAYDPERTCLAIHGKEDLKTLEMYAKKYFSAISGFAEEKSRSTLFLPPPFKENEQKNEMNEMNKQNKQRIIDDSIQLNENEEDKEDKKDKEDNKAYKIFRKEISGKVLRYRPAYKTENTQSSMFISISLPETYTTYRNKTIEYIIELIEGTGQGSFSSVLQKHDIATDVNVCADYNSMNTILEIIIELVDDKEEHIDTIAELFTYYLKEIEKKRTGKEYDMFAKIEKGIFERKESEEPICHTVNIAHNMQNFPTEEVETNSIIWSGLNEEEFSKFFGIIKDRGNWAIFHQTQRISEEEKVQKDKIYGIEYRIDSICPGDKVLLENLKSCINWKMPILEEIDIKEAREKGDIAAFGAVPVNIDIISVADKDQEKEDISKIEEKGLLAYRIPDIKYRSQEVEIMVSLNTLEHLESIEKYAFFIGHIYAHINLFSERYNIELKVGACSICIQEKTFGVSIFFKGLPLVVESMIDKFFEEYYSTAQEIFNSAKQQAISYFEDISNQSPYKRMSEGLKESRGCPLYNVDDVLKCVNTLKTDDIFLIRKADIKLLTSGNISEKEYERVVEKIKKYITPEPLTFTPSPPKKEVSIRVKDPQNIALVVGHLFNRFSREKNIAYSFLLQQIVSEPFFDELRTKKTFGYIVYTQRYWLLNDSYVLFVVQSTKPKSEIENEVSLFISKVKEMVDSFSEEDYNLHRSSAVAYLKEKASNLHNYIVDIFSYWNSFSVFNIDYKTILANVVEDIKKEEFLEYCKDLSPTTTIYLSSNPC